MMAPTEILAKQRTEAVKLLKIFNIKIELLTGNTAKIKSWLKQL